jgi:site-specific DNA recombinase
MNTFFGYIRVSTTKQGEQGVSLQEQRAAILRYAQRCNLELAAWFEERETAAKKGRPIFSQMLKLLRQGKAKGVIIHKIDRSARNLKDWADLGELIDSGIEVHFANESLDLHSRGGRLSADIQAVVAADYIRNLREETRKGFYGRLKQGLYPLPAPIGYLDRGKGKPKELDPERAPLVRKAFELYGSGRYTLLDLVEEMHRLGLRNRRNGRVTRTGFSILLNNPFYIGLIRVRRTGETFPGAHESLIPKLLFDRVQRILTGRVNPRPFTHDFLFRRLLSCKNCGYSLVGELQKGNVYYRCHTRSCPTTSIREESVQGTILEELKPIQFSEQEQEYLRTKVTELRRDWTKERDEQLNALTLTAGQLKERLTRLTDAYLDGTIEKTLFQERKAALLMERRNVEEALAGLREGRENLPDRLAEFLELAGSAYLSYKLGLPEEKRDLLRIVTSNRHVTGNSLELVLNSPFSLVANCHQNSNGGPKKSRTVGWQNRRVVPVPELDHPGKVRHLSIAEHSAHSHVYGYRQRGASRIQGYLATRIQRGSVGRRRPPSRVGHARAVLAVSPAGDSRAIRR